MMIEGKQQMASPLDNKEVMKTFLLWLVISADRARSFDSVCRSASAIMAKRGQANWMKEPDIKALQKRSGPCMVKSMNLERR